MTIARPRAYLPSMVVRYMLAGAVGAVSLTIVGYLVYAASGDAVSFAYWIRNPIRFGVPWWGILGLALGIGARAAARL